jgi:hypothetical protein
LEQAQTAVSFHDRLGPAPHDGIFGLEVKKRSTTSVSLKQFVIQKSKKGHVTVVAAS